jgi:hypothetical protein
MQLPIFILTIVLLIIAYFPYWRGIFKQVIHPHPLTWLSWAIVTLVLALIYLFNNGGFQTWISFLLVINDIAIFIASLILRQKIKITKIDILCFITSLLALILWLVINQPIWSVVIITASQLIAFIPSIRKAYHRPYDESALTWGIHGFRYGLMTLLVVTASFTTLINSIFWSTIYCCSAIFLLWRRKKQPHTNSSLN